MSNIILSFIFFLKVKNAYLELAVTRMTLD
jgi:hypothetical protein